METITYNHIERQEQIDRYVLGRMTESERKMFEQYMT